MKIQFTIGDRKLPILELPPERPPMDESSPEYEERVYSLLKLLYGGNHT